MSYSNRIFIYGPVGLLLLVVVLYSVFWRVQAERLLSAYIWSEGKAPADRQLVVRDVSMEDLDVAARWDETKPFDASRK